jgi:hypothetical protein
MRDIRSRIGPSRDLIGSATDSFSGDQSDHPDLKASPLDAYLTARLIRRDDVAASFAHNQPQLGDIHPDCVVRAPIPRCNPAKKPAC